MNVVPESGFLRVNQIVGDRKKGVQAIIPVSRSTWWAGVRTGRYPQPIKSLGERITVWKAEDIREYIKNAGM